MAADESNAAAPRHHLTVDASLQQIPKGSQGSDNSVPLSPQWLLPKSGDNKLGIVTGEPHFSPHHGYRLDAVKASGNDADLNDTGRTRGIFRPPLHDAETGRRDRWRDEEREANSGIRRDHWREGEKELGDARRIERWSGNFSRHSGEARRAPSERWNDLGNREGNYDQRRESKWNTRWGPDDKESENRRDKWLDSSRDGEASREKGMPHLSSLGKDADNEGDHYSRSWRSNSSLNHGRGDPSQLQSLTPNKQSPMFGYGRGRGENGMSVFPAGRGRINSSASTLISGASRSYHLGTVSDKSDGAYGDPLRYNRMKLLDIYRMTNMKSYSVLLDGFIEVSSLTLAEPLEPLALFSPTPEEMVILKGIDKGDIVSSDMPQVSKDGSVGRNSVDTVPSRQTKLGYREDMSTALDDYKDESANNIKVEHFISLESPSYEPRSHKYGPDSKVDSDQNLHTFEAFRSERTLKKVEEAATRELNMPEDSLPHYVIPWRSQLKDMETERKNTTTVISSYNRDDSRWHGGQGFHSEMESDSKIKRQSSEVLDREREALVRHLQEDPFSSRDYSAARNFQPDPSPEDISVYYKDPQGQIQGPFSGIDLIGWFEAGYFGIDLQVRLASAPADAPFLSLGDVMPHLQTKPRPPPGFGVAKHSNILEVSNKENFGSPINVHAGLGEFELIKNGQKSRYGARTEAENRFLESLMSGNISSSSLENSFTEGMQVRGGTASSIAPFVGGESGSDVNYLLAQWRLSEQQRSSDPHPFWSGREASSIASKVGMVPDSSVPHSMMLPQIGDSPCQVPQTPQNVDLLSILHATADKSPSPTVNSGVYGWSNFPDVRSQQFTSQIGFGVQQQRFQLQNHPSLSHLINQPRDLSSGLIPPEKLVSSEISQDPQILSLLQQQHLLAQLQMHSQVPAPTQLSMLDKILLLKQQQEQEQQQFLLQQQQQMLSQVIPGYQSHQHGVDPSYVQLHAAFAPGNAPFDSVGLRQVHDLLQINQQMPVLNLQDGHTSNLPIMNLQGDVNCPVSSGPLPLNLPHQIFDHKAHSKDQDTTLSQQLENDQNSDALPIPATEENLTSSAMQKSTQETFDPQKNHGDLDDWRTQPKPLSMTQPSDIMTSVGTDAVDCLSPEEVPMASDKSCNSDRVLDMQISSPHIPEQCHLESPVAKEVKNVEVRELNKTSEKKSRKQKNSKLQSASDLGKGSSKTSSCQQPKLDFETDSANTDGTKSKVQKESEEIPYSTSVVVSGESSLISTADALDFRQTHLSSSIDIKENEVETVEGKAEGGEVATRSFNVQTTPCHQAWKPAPGPKAKSLLEIQQEEQQRAQKEKMVSEFDTTVIYANTLSPTPWLGAVAQMEQKPSRDIVQSANGIQTNSRNSENILSSKSRNSQLHDLLAEEVLAKANEGNTDLLANDNKGSHLRPLPPTGAQVDILAVNDDDFIEAKDTKKSRKKASKAKGAGVKNPSPVGSVDLSGPPIPIEKVRYTCQAQEKELSPVPPVGPSLGDFVRWKGDQANSVPGPAWSIDLGKLKKPTSLRDIQKEQEKKTPSVQQQIPIPTPSKVQSNQNSRGSASSWQVSGSSPSKAASPIQSSSIIASQSRARIEDDLFWGPLDQSKQETKQSGFPALANSISRGAKGTSVKGAVGAASNQQKLSNSKPVEYALSSLPSSVLSFTKGRRDSATQHSEAMDFRDWCKSELVRLTGTNDTSFLEFCLKQSTQEAEMLLRENLGSLDRNHEFIDKFLNYKDFLSSEVIEMAFQAEKSRKVAGDGIDADLEMGLDGAARGGKKKGKKVKKVSPSVLGFNVVSNRILMGEIQSIED